MQPTADPTQTAPPGDYVEFLLPGLVVPLPDEGAAFAAWERLSSIDIGVNAPTIAALGMLAESVAFIAGVQATAFPRPILSTRVVLVTGSHAGGVVAGPAPDPRQAVPLQHLAAAAGAGSVTLEWQPASAAIELEDAITPEQMDMAMRAGWAEAERAADEGIEMLVLAAGGAGAHATAVAVISAITGYEATSLLGRVVTPAGRYDDNAWMTRCLALRDALHRVRHRNGDPRTVLAALGGADIAAATGLLLGAASRRMPVMIDGPVGAAAALLANEFAPQSRRWLLMPDTGRNVAVIVAAEALELRPWLDLCLDLGEGATSLAALPMLQTALTLAGAGEPVEATPLTRFDSSTGGQIFVGVARPVEPADVIEDEAPAEAGPPKPARSIGAKAKSGGKPVPPKPAPAKTPAAKTAAAKAAAAKNRSNSGRPGSRSTPARTDSASPGSSGSPASPDSSGSGSAGSAGSGTAGGSSGTGSAAKSPPPAEQAGPAERSEQAGPGERSERAGGTDERTTDERSASSEAAPESSVPVSPAPGGASGTADGGRRGEPAGAGLAVATFTTANGDSDGSGESGTGPGAPRPRKRP